MEIWRVTGLSKKWYNRSKLDKAKLFVDKMFKEARTIEDENGIIRIESPLKISIEPKDLTKLDEMHNETLKKLNQRHILKYCVCYIEGNKIMIEKV